MQQRENIGITRGLDFNSGCIQGSPSLAVVGAESQGYIYPRILSYMFKNVLSYLDIIGLIIAFANSFRHQTVYALNLCTYASVCLQVCVSAFCSFVLFIGRFSLLQI